MNISILSVFPDLYDPFLSTSLIKKACDEGRIVFDMDTLFSFVQPKERIDAPAFGPGAGMVLRPEVVERAIEEKEKRYGRAFKIFFSPRGKKLNQKYVRAIAQKAQSIGHLMLIPARYEGMDERIESFYADEIVSLGDFVLMAGDLPAMVLLEALLRLMPGVIGKQESVEKDSFTGPFVDFPSYTEPVVWKNEQVPAVLRSGNHKAIEEWREAYAIEKTVKYHFDWLRTHSLTLEQKKKVKKFIPNHYVVLNHTDVLIGPDKIPGTTSVTSLDIHDIARSSYTYGIKNFFVVTPLHDQQKIVKTLLDFWQTGPGFSYNRSRFQALQSVILEGSLANVLSTIERQENKKPLLIATSARTLPDIPLITYFDQAQVWKDGRPVVIILGTGKGLSEDFIKTCDYVLLPLDGFTEFNHLSVRSAAAIILDRWLGIDVDLR